MSLAGTSAPRVGIIDYQAGNLQSLQNAFLHLRADVRRITAATDIDWCSHLVLPGVGAFGFCASRLAASGLMPAITAWTFDQRRPLLGICVGMQLMAERSDESPEIAGLGWFGGAVTRLLGEPGLVRVPHVGWNTATIHGAWGDFQPGDQADFYFDHSFAYGTPLRGDVLASCHHGVTFSAAVRHDNVVAAQFHPEKSQAAGLRFLQGFLEL